jgi:hypothetical protein
MTQLPVPTLFGGPQFRLTACSTHDKCQPLLLKFRNLAAQTIAFHVFFADTAENMGL